jgi:hypothetical protein
MKFDYRPLCTGLTLKESPIDGIGLFATEDFKAGIFLGETHIWEERRRDWIRTPLGGFIISTNIHYHNGDQRELYTIRPILEGEELTVYYTLLQE